MIVGYVLSEDTQAFRWENGSMQLLGGVSSRAYGVSGDGSVVVGALQLGGTTRAFRWSNGVMQDLGVLPQYPNASYTAYSVSEDGSVIVGSFNTGFEQRAFRWTVQGGMEDLNETYADWLTLGAHLQVARGVSRDGRYIVGYGTQGAFLLDTRRMPRPAIETVTLQQECQGPYFQHIPAHNALQVRISNWNGAPGRVQVRLPSGVVRVQAASGNVVSIPLNMGEDLVYPRGGGWCQVEVTAYNADNVASETRILHFYAIALPPSLQQAAWLLPPESSFCAASGKVRVRFLVKVPLNSVNAIAPIAARLPFMSNTQWGQRTEWFTAEVELEANRLHFPASLLQGTATIKIGRNISADRQTYVRLPRHRVTIVDWGWEVGGTAQGVFSLSPFQLEELSITVEARVGLETPNLLPILIASCCTPLTPLARVAELYGRFNLSTAGNIKLYDAENGLGFRDCTLNLTLGGELVLSTARDWKDWVYVESIAGAEPFIELQFPGTDRNASFFQNVRFLRQVGISGYLRAKAFVLFCETEYDILSGRYVYPADGMGQLGAPIWMQRGFRSAWRPMERRYLTSSDYHLLRAGNQFFPQSGNSDYTEQTLIQNVFPLADPALAIRNGYPAIAFSYDDPNLPAHQMSEIRVLLQHPDDTWHETIVTQDQALDSQPTMACDQDGNLIVAWTRMENVDSNPNPQLRLQKGEIAYSVYNVATQTWSVPILLTSDSVFDGFPRLTRGADGALYIVWCKSPTNRFPVDLEQETPLETDIWMARWNGTAFVDAQLAVANANTMEVSLAVSSNSVPTLVWTRFSDRRLLYSIYQNGAWTTPAIVWNDTLQQGSPVLTVGASDRPVLYFVRTGAHPYSSEYDLHQLLATDFTGTAWRQPVPILESEGLNDLQVISGVSGKAAALWQRSSEGGVDVWMALYDPTLGQWSAPLRLTRDDNQYEHQLSAVMDTAENPLVVYLKREQLRGNRTVEDDAGDPHTVQVTEVGRADLTLLRYIPRSDLTVERLEMTPPSASPGHAVQLTAYVANLRAHGAVNVQVRFYDGDPSAGGSAIGTATVSPAALVGGGSGTATLNWTLPNDGRSRTLYALIDPDNAITETDETNNYARLVVAELDFEAGVPTLTQYLPNGDVEITYPIANSSSVSPSGTLSWQLRRDSPTGVLIAQGVIPAPPAQQTAMVSQIWTPSGLPTGQYNFYLIIDPSNQFAESDETNNVNSGSIPLMPDLLLNPSLSGLERDRMRATVRTVVHNRGWEDASASLVKVFDGPPSFGATIGAVQVSGVARGGSRALQFQLNLPRRLARVWLVIDPNNAVPDADRSNNIVVLSLSWNVGDANGDGCVDDADLLEVLFAFGQQGVNLPADLNNDGVVDDADLLETLFHFGDGC